MNIAAYFLCTGVVPGKSNQLTPAALAAAMQLAGTEQWMKIMALPCVRPEVLRDAPADSAQWIVAVGMKALTLLAEEKCNPAPEAAIPCKKVDDLEQAFLVGWTAVPYLGDAEKVVHVVQALLKYVIFALNQDLPYTASVAGNAYCTLLVTFIRDEHFRAFPSAWSEAIKKFDPSKIKAATAKQADVVKLSEAQKSWDLCVEEFKAQAAITNGKQSTKKGPAPTTPSPAVDTLMKLTGLETVKQAIVDQYNRIVLAKAQGVPTSSGSYNLRCDGNPGTGKTTVARLYSAFLVEIGVLPKGCGIKETSGSKLISDGVRGLTAMLTEMKEQGGGVVFVDETYQLNPQTDQSGRQVLDFILPQAEKLQGEYGSIVWIFAGYADRMDKLYEHNPGLPSRFPQKLVFEDYTDEELLAVMLGLMARGGVDITTPPPAPAPPPKSAAPIPVNSRYYPYGNRPDVDDQWGNTWKWDPAQNTYKDDYGNISGYGPALTYGAQYKLGSMNNPIVQPSTGYTWYYDENKKVFKEQRNSCEQDWYPGSPKPVPQQEAAKPFTAVDVKWVRVATKRLGRMRGKVGFGNARAVRNLFNLTHARQARRLTELRRSGVQLGAELMQFRRDDLLGPKANRDSHFIVRRLGATAGDDRAGGGQSSAGKADRVGRRQRGVGG